MLWNGSRLSQATVAFHTNMRWGNLKRKDVKIYWQWVRSVLKSHGMSIRQCLWLQNYSIQVKLSTKNKPNVLGSHHIAIQLHVYDVLPIWESLVALPVRLSHLSSVCQSVFSPTPSHPSLWSSCGSWHISLFCSACWFGVSSYLIVQEIIRGRVPI